MKQLVSIIIPCYQQGRFLNDCISSLINQSYDHWEAIIIDDGSTDNTRLIVEDITVSENRVKYFFKSNGGLCSARNLGLEHASGAYIQFLDADDMLEKDKIRAHVDFLDNNSTYKIVYGNAKYFDDSSPSIFRRQYEIRKKDEEWIEKLFLSNSFAIAIVKSNMMPVCCPLLRCEVIKIIGKFDEGLKSLEDWNYWLRAIENKISFFYINSENGDALIRTHLRSMTNNSETMHQAIRKNRIFILTNKINLGLCCWVINARMLLQLVISKAARRVFFSR